MLSAIVCMAAASAFAMEIPERLEYSIRWEFIHAGTSTLEISEDGDDRLKIVSTTKSARAISLFYKVDDRIEVRTARESFLTTDYYLRLREGRHRKERKVRYDHEGGRIELNNIHRNETKEFDFEGEIRDVMSAFYLMRTMEFEVGKPLFIRVFDNGKMYDVEIKVLKKERVRVPAGSFDTIKVKPVLKSEGVFIRKGDVYIWITDDEFKIPVKMKSKVKVGSVNAVLVGGN